jgi:putative transposase
MGLKNRINAGYLYYLTLAIVDWVDVFTRPAYRHIIVEALKYCQENKGLELYSWCLMGNHLHLIASAKENHNLSDILRDFKKHTSRTIVEAMLKHQNESCRQWLLHCLAFAGNYDPKITHYKFWQEGNEAKEVTSNAFLEQKPSYIHQNPVRAGIVAEPEHYLYSSAANYAGQQGLLEVVLAS